MATFLAIKNFQKLLNHSGLPKDEKLEINGVPGNSFSHNENKSKMTQVMIFKKYFKSLVLF